MFVRPLLRLLGAALLAAPALAQNAAPIVVHHIGPFTGVLAASNQGNPAIHFKGTDVAEAYEDVVSRFLGQELPLRFTTYEKPGFLQRIFGGK